jgi:hypothetical protein
VSFLDLRGVGVLSLCHLLQLHACTRLRTLDLSRRAPLPHRLLASPQANAGSMGMRLLLTTLGAGACPELLKVRHTPIHT